MQSSTSHSFVVLSPEAADAKAGSDVISDFFDELTKKITTFKDKSLILDFSELREVDLNKILLFSQLSGKHKRNNKSFVMVVRNLDYDVIPVELVVVPTLREAKDMIEIEDIERDLGI